MKREALLALCRRVSDSNRKTTPRHSEAATVRDQVAAIDLNRHKNAGSLDGGSVNRRYLVNISLHPATTSTVASKIAIVRTGNRRLPR